MKRAGQFEKSKVAYKAIDPRCQVEIRELNRHKAARRLITNNKRKIASAGLIVPAATPIAAGALVEIDVSFPGVQMIYRSRGVVDWVDDREATQNRIGVLVFGMDKLDPNGPAPSTPPPATATEMVEQPPQPETQPQPVSDVEAPAEAVAPEPTPDDTPAPENSSADSDYAQLNMPDDEDLAELFSGLLDAEVTVDINTDKPLKVKRFATIGEYQDDDGKTTTLMAADVALVNYLGSALVMMPREEAENAIKAGTFSDEIKESFQEIYNISASIINDAGNPHVRFTKMVVGKDGIPADMQALIDQSANSANYKIDIPGYGGGRLAILDVGNAGT